jgi:hypothetical protein
MSSFKRSSRLEAAVCARKWFSSGVESLPGDVVLEVPPHAREIEHDGDSQSLEVVPRAQAGQQ